MRDLGHHHLKKVALLLIYCVTQPIFCSISRQSEKCRRNWMRRVAAQSGAITCDRTLFMGTIAATSMHSPPMYFVHINDHVKGANKYIAAMIDRVQVIFFTAYDHLQMHNVSHWSILYASLQKVIRRGMGENCLKTTVRCYLIKLQTKFRVCV